MKTGLLKAPGWQRERAILLHREFVDLERLAKAGAKVGTLIRDISSRLDGRALIVRDGDGNILDERRLKAGEKNLWTLLAKWREGRRTPEALLPNYKSAGSHRQVPDELKAEFQLRATANRGGRDKHGRSGDSDVYKQLCRDWAVGKRIPGVGTWREWCEADGRYEVVPASAPDFPWSERTFRRHSGSDALKAAGNIGRAAALKHVKRVTMDYSKLRRCELYTLDDVRLDLIAINDKTGVPCEVYAYILMEVASRSVVNVMLKTEAHVRAEDVDEVIAHGLQAPGFGIGKGYVTHIKFERGTVACSEAAQMILEEGSGGRIKVHRTGMNGGIRWVGAPADRASGNAAGKAVIESFNRRLHGYLSHLPGQRGNNADNSPANLGVEDRWRAGKGKRKQGQDSSLVTEARQLAMIRREAARSGKAEIDPGLLFFSQVQAVIWQVIQLHNNEAGHDYQGHGRRLEMEVAPGVWVPVKNALTD